MTILINHPRSENLFYTTTQFVELDNKVGADGNKCNFKQDIGIHLIIPPLMILLKLLTLQVVCFALV